VGEEIKREDELVKELEEENKKVILLLKIIHLRWLNKNQIKGIFGYIVIELGCLEIVNQVIYKGLVYNIELKLVV
jgi:hypothetical protein